MATVLTGPLPGKDIPSDLESLYDDVSVTEGIITTQEITVSASADTPETQETITPEILPVPKATVSTSADEN